MVTKIEIDPSTGHYPSPYSLFPLGPVLKGGLMAPGLLGLLSVITTLGLLAFIVYRFSTWRRYYRTYVGYNQYVVRQTRTTLFIPACIWNHANYVSSLGIVYEPVDRRFHTSRILSLLLPLD